MREGVEVIMLTGDNENTAKAVADAIGLTSLKQVVYEDKLKEIKKLQAEGKIVAMAGDGLMMRSFSASRHRDSYGNRNRCSY
jgi:Cu2+-exporting ATPase